MSLFSKTTSNIKEIWITSIKLYQKSFYHIWHLGFISGAGIIISLLLNSINGNPNPNIDSKLSVSLLPLAISLITMYTTSLIILKIYNVGHKKETSWKSTLAFAAKKYFTIIISMLIVILLDLLGVLAFLIPGIFLFVLLIMVQPLVLLDNHGIISSIKHSCKLVWGNWWRTSSIIFPLFFLSYLLNSSAKKAALAQNWQVVGIDILLVAIFYPFLYTSIITVFNDLKIRKNKQKELVVEAIQE